MDKPFSSYQGDDPYLFVCYAHDNADTVYSEISWLNDQGFNIWYDEGLSPGSVWRDELAESITGAKVLLFFVTPQSVTSAHCQREVSFAVDRGIPVRKPRPAPQARAFFRPSQFSLAAGEEKS